MQSLHRRFLAVVLACAGSSLCFGQQFPNEIRHHGMEATEMASISGTVVNTAGKPMRDARIEARAINTTTTIASTYTNDSGLFQLSLPPGTYEIVALAGLSEARERINSSDTGANLTLKLEDGNTGLSQVGGAGSVSAKQYRVPEKARNELRKAEQAAHKQQPTEVEKHLNAALSIYPEFAEALTMRALGRLDHEQLDAAIEDLDHAIKADSSYPMAYLVLGAAFNLTSKWDQAITALDRGLALQPASWQGFFELGKAYLGKADYEHALRTLDKAQSMAPQDYAPLHLVKAHVLLSVKNYNQAMGELQAYLDHAPKNDAQNAQVEQALAQVRAFVASSNTH